MAQKFQLADVFGGSQSWTPFLFPPQYNNIIETFYENVKLKIFKNQFFIYRWVHLATNLITQIFLGVALELRNRWYRIITVYTLGVVAGSLVTSIMDPRVYLAGASGGVYAIITAHLSNIILVSYQ